MIKIKRIYEPKAKEDGFRILIDRLWPRGITKDKSGVDLWLKDISPSNDLRKWFSHDPSKWSSFRKKYQLELETKGELLETVNQLEKEKGVITFLYSAKNKTHNNAIALIEILEVLKS